MADDRPIEEPVDQLGRLQRELDDLKGTLLARITRRPTGDMEPTLRTTAKENTLLLQGQTLNRADYPALWQWVQANGLSPAVFGAGNGTTTFVLPDLRGKAAVGATAVDPVGKSFGSATATLTAAMLPQHSHTIPNQGDHMHSWVTAQGGNHPGHHPTSQVSAQGAPNALGVSPWNAATAWSETHNHSFDSGWGGEHNHGGATGNTGSATPASFFVVQPSYALNWLIWT